jgi:hypothetical protein
VTDKKESAVSTQLEHLYVQVEQTERAWREHRETGWRAWHGPAAAGGPEPVSPYTREWRERERDLRTKFETAYALWLDNLPP